MKACRLFFSVVIFSCCINNFSFAQSRYYAGDSTRASNTKFIGLQANQLLKQFLSFNSSTVINNNPFLLTFSSCNSKGRGFSMGTGLNFSDESSTDGVTSTQIKNRNFVFRFGFEAKFHLSEKWIPFWGLDFHLGGTYTRISTQQFQTFQTNTSTISTTNLFFGPAIRGGVLVSLSKHLLLGTEGFFNFKIAFQQVNSSSNFSSGVPNSSRSIPLNLGINVPTAIFLIVKI
jgi:hypothetical protein